MAQWDRTDWLKRTAEYGTAWVVVVSSSLCVGAESIELVLELFVIVLKSHYLHRTDLQTVIPNFFFLWNYAYLCPMINFIKIKGRLDIKHNYTKPLNRSSVGATHYWMNNVSIGVNDELDRQLLWINVFHSVDDNIARW